MGSAGRIIGTAGGGLVNASWAANAQVARIGRAGEIRTAEILASLVAETGMTVLHDLRLPIPGITANIDHAVVGGDTVLLIDTKVWKPGRYWSFGGRPRRGSRSFEHAGTRTPAMAHQSIGRFLHSRGLSAVLPRPVVAVWSSRRSGRVSLRFLRMDGWRPCRAETLPHVVRRTVPNRAADPGIVRALIDLLGAPGRSTGAPDARPKTRRGDPPERTGRLRPPSDTDLGTVVELGSWPTTSSGETLAAWPSDIDSR